ncbi:MAG: formylglycine-generating enzyme family protein [Stigonema ocellatum SAG 48.90 = DSM 106950]|nr:formylglycine-generating enzyme family protein [Stigonema ocellatum SAG 48.90 = DSM 106950]
MSDGVSSKFEKLIATLQQELKLTGREIADILWLAQQNQTTVAENSHTAVEIDELKKPDTKQTTENPTPDTQTTPAVSPQPTAKAGVYAKSSGAAFSSTSGDTRDIKLPDAPGLREPLKLARALRPLMQKIDSDREVILDEEATANRIAKERIRIPVFQPAQEPAFDLVLVVDESNTMIFWQKTIQELQKLLEIQGAFRDVQVWGLVTNQEGHIYVRRGTGKTARKHRHYQPHSLIDPSGKRLFLLASDCVTDIWHNGKAFDILKIWAQKNPVAIIQMLPQWLWQRTGLSFGAKVQFVSLTPRIANQGLLIKKILLWDDIDFRTGTKIPIFTLEEDSARTWSKMIAGRSDANVTGFVFPSKFTPIEEISPTPKKEEIEEITSNFRRTASPIARKLASLLSAAPVITLPIVRIIQAQMLKESQQVHVAEVFLGGILKRKQEIDIIPETNPDDIEFDFINQQIRDNFLEAASVTDSLEIIEEISKYFAKKLNKTLREFNALLRKPQHANNENIEIKPFALLTAKVLKRLGGDYIQFAEEMEQEWKNSDPKLIPLSDFTFKVVTVNRRGEIINQETKTAQYFSENLHNNVILEMVAIPHGTFLMGSPSTEEGHRKEESPQHEVTVPPFFMGKYPVTQAQWRAVAALEQVNRELNPDPSNFKGDNLPVEKISWYAAVEFCDRLSKHTKKDYRLPSEAEWEYACRAGTTTPFHFGETITSDLANYNAKYTYGDSPKGEGRSKTTEVGSFGVANAFGLYDMHGNLWEWCADHWHDNYNAATTDSSAWINENNYQTLLRGGSWNYYPQFCRSANRYRYAPDNVNVNIGFRVVCVPPSRTLST